MFDEATGLAFYSLRMDEQQIAKIDGLILDGKMLWAVRQYRRATGSKLAEAKAYVDARSEDLSKERSKRAKDTPPVVDLAVARRFTRIEEDDLAQIRSACSQLETVLYGLNYQVTVEVVGQTYTGDSLPVADFIRIVYPKSEPHLASTMKVDRQTMRSELTANLSHEGDSGAGPQFTPERRSRVNAQLLPSLFKHLDHLMAPESTVIYSYNSDVGLPGYYMFWFSAFVLDNTASQTALILSAVASD